MMNYDERYLGVQDAECRPSGPPRKGSGFGSAT